MVPVVRGLEDSGQRPAKPAASADKQTPRHVRSLMSTSQSAHCLKCGGNHSVQSCQAFQTASVASWWELIKPSELCINCLKGGHRTWDCTATPRPKCKKRRHLMLHTDSNVVDWNSHKSDWNHFIEDVTFPTLPTCSPQVDILIAECHVCLDERPWIKY